MNIKCSLCHQVISAGDTVEPDGHGVAHADCRRPRSLSPEEHVFLYVYCWDHAVAECEACGRAFLQRELGADRFRSCTYECPNCETDLTPIIRAHLTEQLRRRVRVARETAQRLLKRGQQLSDQADALMRETEAALAELKETRKRARRTRDER